ncbi:MAG TPA: DUF3857 domain-containing protein [Vicinamibacterales bacterium]|nr:DUF3857 domain-containing protein [Vicinamibacterales bacterium]
MLRPVRLSASRIVLVAACLFGACPVATAADWPAIAPADAALKAPRLDPQADAEALLWDVRVTDSDERDEFSTILKHHVRIKVFSDRGREAHGTIELLYTPSRRVREIEGRTVALDGTVTELRSQDIFDREIIRASGLKVRVKSFAMPAVVPGSIIEYRWTEIRDDSVANYLELPMQRDIPTYLVRYHLRPLAVRDLGYQMRTEWYNVAKEPERIKEENGYTIFQVRDVPALKDEPYMPPELAVKPWMLIFYADLAETGKTPEKYWTDFAKANNGAFKTYIKASNELKQAASELSKRTTEPVTIERLVAFARERIKREGAGRRKDNRTVTDAFKRGTGTGDDQTLLVAALAPLVGLDTHLALLPDRSEFFSGPAMRQPHFISHVAVALETPQGWRFVDPANQHAKDGQLPWQYDGQYALILDDKTPQFVNVPPSPLQDSNAKRTVALKLLESGAIEGEVTLSYTGHLATRYRDRDDDSTPAEREQRLKDDYIKRWPGAAISNVRFEQLEDPQQPYVIRFAVSIPNYAQKTGSRLFVQPAVLQHGLPATFTQATRTHRVIFPFAWLEEDTVTIDVPEGYELEPGDPIRATALAGGAAAFTAKVSFDASARRATFARGFSLGGFNRLFWEAKDYPAIKNFFDEVQRQDGYTLSLRKRQ